MLLAIGSSHLTALAAGYKEYCGRHSVPFPMQRLQLQNPAYKPFTRMQDRVVIYNEKLRQDIAAAIATPGVRQIVCCIGGAAHNVVGLVNDPRPFDVLLPGATVDDTVADAEVLPYDVVAETVRHRTKMHIDVLRLVKTLADDLPVCQLCPPPPVAREALVLSRPSSFASELEERGLAPASLRWKLWRTYCNMMADVCAELGVTCLDAPDECLDPAGFLREELWGDDPTHANAEYGILVIEQLMAAFAGELA
jgi:hypothetical protein